jgi:ribulose-bisphosphate carboxylase large chain
VQPRIHAIYHVRSNARSIEARAHELAVEQSVEMPVAAIEQEFVRREIVGRVEGIAQAAEGLFEVRIGLAQQTVGGDAGQMLNMLFGNSSLQHDVLLHDVELPIELARWFGGPCHGLDGLRRRVGAGERALTCSALKPQGLPPTALADLAARFAMGGVDYIKDDHGLADQSYSRFEPRVEAVTRALAGVERPAGGPVRYVPSVAGDLDAMRSQLAFATAAGVDSVVVAPMIMGLSNFQRIVGDNPGIAFIAHPSMAGAARIAPALLLGKLFRLLGADGVIFPHHGGRFGYSPDTCRAIASQALTDRDGLRSCAPVPAGGMALGRVTEMLDFYGTDVMLLIGGALLEAGENLVDATSAFVAAAHGHAYGRCDELQ